MVESNPTSDAQAPTPEEAPPGQDPLPPANTTETGIEDTPVENAETEVEAAAPVETPEEVTGEENQETGEPEEELDPVTALEIEVAKWKDLALRSRADLDNFRKRMSTEKSESIRYANQSLFESLLPVLDNFHFGLDAARTATDPQGVLMGMEMVLKQFEDFLESHRITKVAAEPGTAFDPNVHEAMAQEHDPEVAEGAILKVIRAGYRMGDRLVRASNVVVSKGPEPTN